MNQDKNKSLESLYEFLNDALKPTNSDNKMFELKSLWLTDKRKIHSVGDMVSYDGCLFNNVDKMTHRVTALRGNLRDTHHEIDLEDLNDGSLLTVKL
jgi:hypothetical protein